MFIYYDEFFFLINQLVISEIMDLGEKLIQVVLRIKV